MHPNAFLKTFWQLQLKPQVFVAMSFDPHYRSRFENVIAPAVRSTTANGARLEPYRVDLSKSGDSILTEIVDGIAHSTLVLADVSTVGSDSETGHPYRNGNVMYEVGVALACRQPHEVLLIRDDSDRFLFDVSTIPHKQIDFTDEKKAVCDLREELAARLREATYVNDARVQIAMANLTGGEVGVLRHIAALKPGQAIQNVTEGNVAGLVSIPRLLDKQLIRHIGKTAAGHPGYVATALGRVVVEFLKARNVFDGD